MKRFVIGILLAIAVMSQGEVEIIQEQEVYVLDDTNFEDAIRAFEYVFVEFYAPWC